MTKVFLLILVAGFALCGSSTSGGDNTVSKSDSVINETDSSAGKNASQTVRKFMKLIAAGENEKAKALMFDPKVDIKHPELDVAPSEGIISGYEGPHTLDWVTVLADRKYRLSKIISERSDEDTAEVETELNTEDMKSFVQKTVFELRKVNDQWKISEVNLIDKYASPVPKPSGA